MFDAAILDLDGTQALTATVVGPWVEISGAQPSIASYEVVLPIVPTGTSPTLDIKLDISPDQTNIVETLTFPTQTAVSTVPAALPTVLATHLPSGGRARYLRATFTVGGTTPSYGKVMAGVSMGTHFRNRAG